MAAPEHASSRSSEADLQAALAAVERKLELAAAMENPLERFWIQEQLLDLQDTLQAALNEAISSTDS